MRADASFEIAGRPVGRGAPCFLIAEAGVNHNGDLDLALGLVDAAASAGADAVKFQSFRAERLVTAWAPKAGYQQRNTGAGGSQLEMLRRLELTDEQHRKIAARCAEKGVLFLSTPFDEERADFLAGVGVPAFKVSSGDLTNTPFLEHLARKGLPVLLSTGMGTLEETRGAVQALSGVPGLAVLHCVSRYPADPAEANLRAMETIRRTLRVPVGYSDHTEGALVALASVAMGACVLEKHITLDRALPGPDHRASLEPAELAELVRGVRIVEQAFGHGRKEPVPGEKETAAVARRSLVAACELPAGTLLAPQHLAVRRPGTGISPGMRDRLLGRKLKVALAEGALIHWEMVE